MEPEAVEPEAVEPEEVEPEVMEFNIDLIAKTSDAGGMVASFNRQLEEFGGVATLINQGQPYKVVMGSGFHFESVRTYHIVLA